MFPLPRNEGVSWSQYVQDLRGKYQRIMEAMCKIQNTALNISDPAICFHVKSDIKVGDTVYLFRPLSNLGSPQNYSGGGLDRLLSLKRFQKQFWFSIQLASGLRDLEKFLPSFLELEKWVDSSSMSRHYVVDLDDIRTSYNEGMEENITYGTEEEDDTDIIMEGTSGGQNTEVMYMLTTLNKMQIIEMKIFLWVI